MNKKILALLASIVVIPTVFATVASNINNNKDNKVVKVNAETRPIRSHKGLYLTNPLAVQVPRSTNHYAVIKDLYGLTCDLPTGAAEEDFAKQMSRFVVRSDFTENHDINGVSVTSVDPLKSTKYWVTNLNYLSQESDSIALTFEGTNDIDKAITGIIGFATNHSDWYYWETPFTHTIKIHGSTFTDVTFYPIGAYNYAKRGEWHGGYFPLADFNDTEEDSDYVRLYYTMDKRIGKPLHHVFLQLRQEGASAPTATDEFIGNYAADDGLYACNVESNADSDFDGPYYYDSIYLDMCFPYYTDSIKEPCEEPYNIYYKNIDDLRENFSIRPSEKYPGYLEQFRDKYNRIITPTISDVADGTLYLEYIKDESATVDQQLYFFKNKAMRLNDTNLNNVGTGLCISKDYYNYAKAVIINIMDNDARTALKNIYNDSSKANTEEYKAFQRFVAWSAANGESINIETTGAITFNSSTSLNLVPYNSNNSISVILMVIVLVLQSTITVVTLIRKKKIK